jgi:hypothetical protein
MAEWKYSSAILDLGTRWRSMVSFTPQPLYSWGRSSRHPLYRSLDEPQSPSGRCGVEKNLLPLLGIGPRPSSPYLIAIPTELSHSFKIYFSIILHPRLYEYLPTSLPRSVIPTKILYAFLFSHMRVVCPIHFILVYFIIITCSVKFECARLSLK